LAQRIGVLMSQRQKGGRIETAVDAVTGAKWNVNVQSGIWVIDSCWNHEMTKSISPYEAKVLISFKIRNFFVIFL
jgi:hypothetical protein